MTSKKPLIAIVDWAASPLGDPQSAAERSVIGDAADVRHYLCASDADFTDEICDAKALVAWRMWLTVSLKPSAR